MRNSLLILALLAATAVFGGFHMAGQTPRSGNPILPGWYADPEAHIFEHEYWIYPTYSAPYGEQTFLDAFSSSDLVTWTKHPRVLDTSDVTWAKRAMWAPSVIEKDGAYYMFFGANDIQNDNQVGGIGVARARIPAVRSKITSAGLSSTSFTTALSRSMPTCSRTKMARST